MSGTFQIDERVESGRRVSSADAPVALGPDLFGDSVSLATGALSFSVTDIDLPGNGSLPVRLTRTYSAGAIEGPTAAGQLGQWDLDLPHMSGIYGRNAGWRVVGPEPLSRCSAQTHAPPAASSGAGTFGYQDYWRGISVYVPGYGSSLLLRRHPNNTVAPEDGRSYPWVARDNWQFRCLTSLQNGPGEGFIGVSPEGVTYRFDWIDTRGYSTIQRQMIPGAGIPQLQREMVRIYATRIEDRFGNWVEFKFEPGTDQVTEITAKDGRQISLRYNANTGTLREAQAGDDIWTYEYTPQRFLTRVVLPDGSDWEIGSAVQVLVYQQQAGGLTCALPMLDPAVTNRVLPFKHPSGARAEFEIGPVRFARNSVPRGIRCKVEEGRLNGGVATQFDGFALRRKTIQGPATPIQNIRYDYSPASIESDRRTVTITHPDGSRELQTFSTVFDVSEGKLIERIVQSAAGQELLREIYAYQTDPKGMPYPYIRGYGVPTEFTDEFGDSRVVPLKQRTTQLQGASFTWTAEAFNHWGQPVEVSRASSLGHSKRERFSLRDYPAIWVLNQFINRQDVDVLSQALTVEQVHFRNASNALTMRITNFLVGDFTRFYGSDGTLQSAIFPNGSNVQLQDYFRGVPRRIVHSADNSAVSATVDTLGRVRSVTDALLNTTNYEYDALGRLTQTRFPTGDSTSWNNQDTSYEVRTLEEYGIPGGLWKRTQTRGRYEHVTWYDALWRPILTRERDVNLAGSERFVRKAYDARGNLSFESYPGHLATPSTSFTTLTTGITRQYDALNRPTVETRSSELGNLVSRREYLAGFQVRDVNARNQATTTSFMAYDEPTFDWPVQISEPENKLTVIQRDRWGKPTAITRSGWYLRPNGQWEQNSATRQFVYDANQRLCKRIDPEHGATVMDYDNASRLAWTADGLNLPSTSQCDRESVPANQRVVRSYNTKDELIGIDYPDSTDDVSYTYHLDGKLHTASVGPLGSRITRTYAYNKRRLPTQELLQIDGFNLAIGYRYSSEGALSELGYPDATWEALNPDGLGRPTTMGQFASNVTWHRFGPLAGFTYGLSSSGMSFSQSLNVRGLPSERRDLWFGNARLHDSLSWDGNGNLTAITDNVGSVESFRNASRSMVYDGLDRLTIANSAPQPQLRGSTPWAYSWGEASFSYDGLDNIRTFKMASVDFTYAYDPNGRLQSVSQAGASSPFLNYTHNARGQMTGRQFGGQQFTLNWDSAHRVTQTWNAASSVVESYRYDAHGHRVRTVRGGETVYQVYTQAGDLLSESSSSGTMRKYARLGGRLIGESTNGVRRAIHTDVIGSVRQKTDAFGTLVHEDVRAPYGSTLIGWQYQNGPAFTGHMEDGATGLTYMKARYYDPVAMRFISPDPVYVDLSTGGNFNRYWYANNNPYTYTDPDGRLPLLAVPIIVGITLFSTSEVANAPAPGEQTESLTTVDRLEAAAGALPPVRAAQGARVILAASSGEGVSQRAASREARREVGIPTSQQPSSQSNGRAKDGTPVGRQQTYDVPAAGGGTQQKSVQVSRDLVGDHAGMPQIEAGTVKPGGQVDAGGRPRLQNEGKVRIDFDPKLR